MASPLVTIALSPPTVGTRNDYLHSATPAEKQTLAGLREALADLIADERGAHPRFNLRDDNGVLLRFLRRHGPGAGATEAAVRAAWAWRAEAGADDGLDALAARLPPALAVPGGWITGGMFGRDRDGAPVFWNPVGRVYGKQLARHAAEQDMINYATWLNETATACLQAASTQADRYRRMVVVMDLRGLGLRHITYRKGMKVGKRTAAIAENHYPDRLKHCYVVNAPGLFAKAWKLVKGWFSEQTQKSTTIVAAKDTRAKLEAIIAPEHIPDFIFAKKGQVRPAGKAWSATVNCPEGPCPAKFAPSFHVQGGRGVQLAPATALSNHVTAQFG